MTEAERLRKFEAAKEQLRGRKLPPAEYQKEVQRLAKRLKI